MDRREFLRGLILSLPAAKLLTNVSGAWGSPPIGKRLKWDELQVFFPGFAREQKKLIAEAGLGLLETDIYDPELKRWKTCRVPLEEQDYYGLFKWPKYDPTDGLSIMDAYAKALHPDMGKYTPKGPGIEGWFDVCTDWCILPKPIAVTVGDKASVMMVQGVHSWNEFGEPGGSNPGPTYHFLIDGRWVVEFDLIRRHDGHTEYGSNAVIDAFYSVV